MIYCLLGASGSGKSSIGKLLGIPEIKSHTTRDIRQGETGNEYYFVTKEEYDKIDFLEKVEYAGNFYGTSVREVEKYIKEDKDCYAILNRDGCDIFRKKFGNKVKIIYLSIDYLTARNRMQMRGDDKIAVGERLNNAVNTGEFYNYDIASYVINNNFGSIESKVDEIKNIIKNNKLKVYISGKISGLEQREYLTRFNNAERELREKGYIDIISPINLPPYNDNPTWKNYMITCLQKIVECDRIFVITKGCNDSFGVKAELDVAKHLGIPVYYI